MLFYLATGDSRTMISLWNSRSTVANLGGDREKANWPMALRDASHRSLAADSSDE